MSSSHPTRPYVFGSSTEEIERLQKLDRLLGPATRQFLREAGIVEGMNVLDAGCGPGQLSFLLADTGDRRGLRLDPHRVGATLRRTVRPVLRPR